MQVTIATGESPHQPNNTVNCPRNIRHCGVIWLVNNYTAATERIRVAGGDDDAASSTPTFCLFPTEVIATLTLTECLDFCSETLASVLQDQMVWYSSNAIDSHSEEAWSEFRQGNEKTRLEFPSLSTLPLGKCCNSTVTAPRLLPSRSSKMLQQYFDCATTASFSILQNAATVL
jgi:hypothetical protein